MHMAAVSADRTPEPVRSFGTFTADLHRLVDWFTECGVETVVMESTGVYWVPIFELLDTRGFAVFVVNARDAKHVPGRKTDVSDAQWLQRLHSYGLLSTSFRPKGRIAELRSYVRQRERLLEYAASHIQHMQKALMEMNLQVHHEQCRFVDLNEQLWPGDEEREAWYQASSPWGWPRTHVVAPIGSIARALEQNLLQDDLEDRLDTVFFKTVAERVQAASEYYQQALQSREDRIAGLLDCWKDA